MQLRIQIFAIKSHQGNVSHDPAHYIVKTEEIVGYILFTKFKSPGKYRLKLLYSPKKSSCININSLSAFKSILRFDPQQGL